MVAPTRTLGTRALNRALLARQWMLRRVKRSAGETLTHLVGMQAQVPDNPYVAMWSRLDGFDPARLSTLVLRRRAVRMTLQRGTLHLVTAADAVALRPLVQPVIDRMYGAASIYGKQIRQVDPAALITAARELMVDDALTNSELARALVARFPGHDGNALAHGVRALVPVVQVAPRGAWGHSAQAAWFPLATYLARRPSSELSLETLVRRYLAAFGPATVADMQSWCGLTRLREVFDRLRPSLITFRDPSDHELFDLPRAPRPAPETPAPPRFLPEYDNLLLGHADRTRMGTAEVAARINASMAANQVLGRGFLLVDGVVAGLWKLDRDGAWTTVAVEPLRPIAAADRAAVTEEGERLLVFAAPATRPRVRFGAMR